MGRATACIRRVGDLLRSLPAPVAVPPVPQSMAHFLDVPLPCFESGSTHDPPNLTALESELSALVDREQSFKMSELSIAPLPYHLRNHYADPVVWEVLSNLSRSIRISNICNMAFVESNINSWLYTAELWFSAHFPTAKTARCGYGGFPWKEVGSDAPFEGIWLSLCSLLDPLGVNDDLDKALAPSRTADVVCVHDCGQRELDLALHLIKPEGTLVLLCKQNLRLVSILFSYFRSGSVVRPFAMNEIGLIFVFRGYQLRSGSLPSESFVEQLSLVISPELQRQGSFLDMLACPVGTVRLSYMESIRPIQKWWSDTYRMQVKSDESVAVGTYPEPAPPFALSPLDSITENRVRTGLRSMPNLYIARRIDPDFCRSFSIRNTWLTPVRPSVMWGRLVAPVRSRLGTVPSVTHSTQLLQAFNPDCGDLCSVIRRFAALIRCLPLLDNQFFTVFSLPSLQTEEKWANAFQSAYESLGATHRPFDSVSASNPSEVFLFDFTSGTLGMQKYLTEIESTTMEQFCLTSRVSYLQSLTRVCDLLCNEQLYLTSSHPFRFVFRLPHFCCAFEVSLAYLLAQYASEILVAKPSASCIASTEVYLVATFAGAVDQIGKAFNDLKAQVDIIGREILQKLSSKRFIRPHYGVFSLFSIGQLLESNSEFQNFVLSSSVGLAHRFSLFWDVLHDCEP